ncbi:HAMP domain-containing histidine kinase [Myxococcus sp. CA056]|uniref:sensor histidine kinase n=1 Tax=unclassified Myxococcus TaxID=2648731 RepID=UPI00157B605C|nr:HAMP domain-containing histidine kinase [Myxococcus sp. CA056]NTX40244.1 HAMP domain-containing histidine kinase [Myxococcus sp. CA033]
MPPGELPYLFERLTRGPSVTGKPQGGIGLGLFIAKQVVRAHEGTIQVRSSRENGTTVTVRLPRRASS